MDSLEGARKAKADADASLKVSNDLVAAVEAKLQQLQDKFMEVRRKVHILGFVTVRIHAFARGQSEGSGSSCVKRDCFVVKMLYLVDFFMDRCVFWSCPFSYLLLNNVVSGVCSLTKRRQPRKRPR